MINKKDLLRKVIKAIDSYPTNIYLNRKPLLDDGLGGSTEGEEILVSSFKGFIDKDNSKLSIAISDGGISRKLEATLIAPYDGSFEIQKGDYFFDKGIKYTVKNPNLQLDVCYLAELEVRGAV